MSQTKQSRICFIAHLLWSNEMCIQTMYNRPYPQLSREEIKPPGRDMNIGLARFKVLANTHDLQTLMCWRRCATIRPKWLNPWSLFNFCWIKYYIDYWTVRVPMSVFFFLKTPWLFSTFLDQPPWSLLNQLSSTCMDHIIHHHEWLNPLEAGSWWCAGLMANTFTTPLSFSQCRRCCVLLCL